MEIRLFQSGDVAKLKEIFAQQDLPVYLPVPGEDKGVLVAMVGLSEEDNKTVEMAAVVRLCVEVHLVIPPTLPNAARKVMELRREVEGAVKMRSSDLERFKFGAVTYAQALAPKDNERMMMLMKLLGFVPELGDYQLFFRQLPK